jgi:hypothetical protein
LLFCAFNNQAAAASRQPSAKAGLIDLFFNAAVAAAEPVTMPPALFGFSQNR